MIGYIVIGVLLCTLAGLVPQLISRDTMARSVKWAIAALVGNIIFISAQVYLAPPAHVGPLDGYQFLWLPLLVNTVIGLGIALFKSDSFDGDEETSTINMLAGAGNGAILLILFVVMAIIAMATTWGEGNAKARAYFLPIEEVQIDPSLGTNAPESFPDNDPAHIIMVEEATARHIGSRAIGQTGVNFGSTYKPGTYTKQMVQGHMYWVAPVEYQNFFANLKLPTTPGVIVVDAENPMTEPRFDQTCQLRYVQSAILNQDPIRYLYISGYDQYLFVDPTFEYDDNWVPYITVDGSIYQRGLYGSQVVKVFTINVCTGEIAEYSLADKPAWIDRILPLSAIDQNLDDYGNFYKGTWPVMFNTTGQGIETRADDTTPTAYSSVSKSPVYQYVMTSKNTTDFSSLGIILVDTNSYTARRFPIYGLLVGSKVTDAFMDIEWNKAGDSHNYDITEPVLYNIYGRLTWVTTYINPASNGMADYKSIAFLDAYFVSSANVIRAETKEEALLMYQLWQANRPSNDTDPGSTANLVPLSGEIIQFNAEVKNGNTIYYFMIKGEDGVVVNTIFSVTPTDAVREIRFTEYGDQVSFTYVELGSGSASVSSFDNLNVP